ncbi:Na+/H+ antiporter [Penicillium argentinense]|uniref:Na+/H+ antiporter n=1 Tax=Penicillium argentinense TaxID=1131581 RepID=A0A9W9G528_9EURO|nr:Na+/H+ antiporter [Penicillium argentinense]KAJ5112146.1 Na+/H+ antiporter [Penicillium argentinense]
MAGESTDTALAYHEPSISTLLNQAGFLVVLNLVNVCLDKLLYCGLIGQLFIGILWGTPGAKWLDRGAETVIQQLGYLGLIMLVYEGGLSTSIKSVKSNLMVSLCVAITGIGVPMGLSFILRELVGANSLQAFAAGAALSATSLGTTFTILSTTKLISTRLGTVTTSAAMLDDVVGLVMVQIITNLGGNASSFDAVTVIRPVFVPIFIMILSAEPRIPDFMRTMEFAFLYQTAYLVGTVAGATYAGTSSLFAAYLAGVTVTWFDDLIKESRMPLGTGTGETTPTEPDYSNSQSQDNNHRHVSTQTQSSNESSPSAQDSEAPTGEKVYEKYYKQPVTRILTPLFFASIGFAIPITEMFKGSVVWRGFIYSLLMMLGKMITGLWLVRFSLHPVSNIAAGLKNTLGRIRLICRPARRDEKKNEQPNTTGQVRVESSEGYSDTSSNQQDTKNLKSKGRGSSTRQDSTIQAGSRGEPQTSSPERSSTATFPPKPKSLYPPSILGLAMVARGEVGYLIASLAQSQGMFENSSSSGTSEIYLVIIWAISICTLVGPICVGTLVRRVKRLQETRGESGPDPLGVWGI